jgi:hypothetical protein
MDANHAISPLKKIWIYAVGPKIEIYFVVWCCQRDDEYKCSQRGLGIAAAPSLMSAGHHDAVQY